MKDLPFVATVSPAGVPVSGYRASGRLRPDGRCGL